MFGNLMRRCPSAIARSRLMAATALLLVAALMLSGCGRNRSEESTATSLPAPSLSTPAAEAPAVEPPGAQAANETPPQSASPLAQPDSPLPAASPLPTPTSIAESLGLTMTADTGILTGVLYSSVDGSDKPVGDLIIGLAEVIRDENGVPKASGYDAAAAARTATDASGRFSFSNIKPGLYTLIADYVVTQVQLHSQETGDTILVEVKPGEVTDLGENHFVDLPMPN